MSQNTVLCFKSVGGSISRGHQNILGPLAADFKLGDPEDTRRIQPQIYYQDNTDKEKVQND
jgi:hypothetical protein